MTWDGYEWLWCELERRHWDLPDGWFASRLLSRRRFSWLVTACGWTGSVDGREASKENNGNAENEHDEPLFWIFSFRRKEKVSRF